MEIVKTSGNVILLRMKIDMKDPYFIPVILGGLIIPFLTLVFPISIFLWAGLGGYVAVRVSHKNTKQILSLLDSTLIGLFSGIVGGTATSIIFFMSSRDLDTKRLFMDILKQNWPPDLAMPANVSELFPMVIITSSLLILLICIVFSIVGALIGYKINKKQNNKPVKG